jgi:hypothetical protein
VAVGGIASLRRTEELATRERKAVMGSITIREREMREMTEVSGLAAAVLGLIALGRHQRPDVCRTVAKHNAPAGFVVSQEVDGVTIGEDQISQVQHEDTTGRLFVDSLAELVHVVSAKSAADPEHHRSGRDAMDFHHWPLARRQLPGQGPS